MSEKKQGVKVLKKGKIKIKKRGKVKIKTKIPDCNVLEEKYIELTSNDLNLYNAEQAAYLKCISDKNRRELTENKSYDFLYPSLEDPNFNIKIAKKKEFYDNRYEEKTREDFQNIKEISQLMCENTEFELEPHQMFVRNYMSFQTPYNGLLLFHYCCIACRPKKF
jgi:hypothetical protein